MGQRTAIDLYDGEVRIWFNQESHTYTHGDGSFIANPSSVNKLLNKKFLIQWAANKGGDRVEDMLHPHREYDAVEITKIASEVRRAHEDYSKGKMMIGSTIHAWVEEHIKYRLGKRPAKQVPGHEGPIKNGVLALLEFEERWDPEWLFTERVVYSRKNDHTGTCDAAAVIAGRVVVLDWKSGSGVYLEHAYQMASYVGALAEEEPALYDGAERGLVRLNTDSATAKPYWESDIQKTLTGGNVAQDYEQFIRLLDSWRTIQGGPQGWQFR